MGLLVDLDTEAPDFIESFKTLTVIHLNVIRCSVGLPIVTPISVLFCLV